MTIVGKHESNLIAYCVKAVLIISMFFVHTALTIQSVKNLKRIQNEEIISGGNSTIAVPRFSNVGAGTLTWVRDILVIKGNTYNGIKSVICAGTSILSFGSVFTNKNGYIIVGKNILCGDWILNGMLHFDLSGNVFSLNSKVRGHLGSSVLIGVNLIDIDFQGVDFGTSLLCRTIFAGSNLTNAKLEKADVRNANFKETIGLTIAQKQSLVQRGAII